MKEEKGLTYIGMVFLIILIAILVFGAIYFFRIEQWKADLENVKTDMLLIQAKVKNVSNEQTLEKKENVLIGTKISDMEDNNTIKEFLEKDIIDIESKKNNYYVLNQEDLGELEIDQVQLEDNNLCIVDYKTNEVIYTSGFLHTDGNTYYKLSDIEKLSYE